MQWEIVKNLNENESADWKELASLELGDVVHPDRLRGFCLAREALRLCFTKERIFLSISQLIVQNFKQVLTHPDVVLSLSHSKEAGAAIIASKKVYRAVGIDLERQARDVKETIALRITNKNDLPLERIKMWCVKEATFKALMNTGVFLKNIEFSDIEIKATTFSHSPTGISGEWDLEILTPFVVAKAWIYN